MGSDEEMHEDERELWEDIKQMVAMCEGVAPHLALLDAVLAESRNHIFTPEQTP